MTLVKSPLFWVTFHPERHMYNGNHLTIKKKKKLRILAIKSEQKFYFYLQIKKRNSPRHVEVFILFVIKNALNTINRNLEAQMPLLKLVIDIHLLG